jgi:hypothetical protein
MSRREARPHRTSGRLLRETMSWIIEDLRGLDRTIGPDDHSQEYCLLVDLLCVRFAWPRTVPLLFFQ